MKQKKNAVKDFKNLIDKIFQWRLDEVTRDQAKNIMDAVVDCDEEMHWLYCHFIGLKRGSTYAQGARRLKRIYHL